MRVGGLKLAAAQIGGNAGVTNHFSGFVLLQNIRLGNRHTSAKELPTLEKRPISPFSEASFKQRFNVALTSSAV